MMRHLFYGTYISVIAIGLSGCAGGTKNVTIEQDFPVPLIDSAPVSLTIVLDEEIKQYKLSEEIKDRGTWEVEVGTVQENLFSNLGSGLLEDFAISDTPDAGSFDGVLRPKIVDMQFSLPAQTRSTFYEIWIRYQFQLLDKNKNIIAEWDLPAYGKANEEDYGGSSASLRAAAIAACRDAMAFFAINFQRQPAVSKWIAAGKPSLPPPTQASATPPPPTDGPTNTDEAGKDGTGKKASESVTSQDTAVPESTAGSSANEQ